MSHHQGDGVVRSPRHRGHHNDGYYSPTSLIGLVRASAVVIGGRLFLWGGVLRIVYCRRPKTQPIPEDGSEGGGDVDAARPGGEPSHPVLASDHSDEAGAGGAGRPGGIAVGDDDDHVRAGGQ